MYHRPACSHAFQSAESTALLVVTGNDDYRLEPPEFQSAEVAASLAEIAYWPNPSDFKFEFQSAEVAASLAGLTEQVCDLPIHLTPFQSAEVAASLAAWH